jgi:hypothetical protein
MFALFDLFVKPMVCVNENGEMGGWVKRKTGGGGGKKMED